MNLPCVVSEMLAGAAEAEAIKIEVPVSIAVVDSDGGLQLFKRMDGTLPISTELAVSKAYTAAILRMPTHQVGELAQPGAALYGIQHTHNGKIVLFGGGFPLCIEGTTVAAIGVSGGTVEQDMRVAQSALQMLRQIESWAREIRVLLPLMNANGHLKATPAAKETLLRAFAGFPPQVPEAAITALTGGVLLALT